ncbi:MAG TPA: sugar porter family MFS transporter [Ktedonobacteraceae bacterium]|nr:sugar porter family MFS transporter [Ktedonobacteraceae bacterium]
MALQGRDSAQSAPATHSRRLLSVYFIAAIAALGGLLFGYDTGVISGALLFLKQTFALNSTQQEIATSAVLVGAIIGAISAGRINDAIGRKKTLLLLAVIFTLGAIVTAFSPNFIFFLVCRIVVGLGIGAAASVVPIYISEVSPARLRGSLVTFNQLAITVGIAVSYWVDLAFAHFGMGWPPMFAAAAIPSVLLFLGMLICPETPRWYAGKGRWDEARHVIEGIKGTNPDREIADIRASLREERQQAGFKELFSPGVRAALIVGVGLAVFQQFVGINTVIYYAPTIFQQAGFASASAAIFATSVVGIVNVLATILAIFLVDRVGRRVLLLSGSVIMFLALVAIGYIFATHPKHVGGLTLTALIVYILAFALSFGPVFWVMSAEIFPTRVRATGASFSSFSNWVANLLVSLTFLSLIGAIGEAFTFWLFALMALLAFLFCWRLVPETKGRSLEQIEHYWENGRHWDEAA